MEEDEIDHEFDCERDDEKYSVLFDEIVVETDMSWLLDIDCEEIWFPKSLCRIEENEIIMPYWLAEKNNLI